MANSKVQNEKIVLDEGDFFIPWIRVELEEAKDWPDYERAIRFQELDKYLVLIDRWISSLRWQVRAQEKLMGLYTLRLAIQERKIARAREVQSEPDARHLIIRLIRVIIRELKK